MVDFGVLALTFRRPATHRALAAGDAERQRIAWNMQRYQALLKPIVKIQFAIAADVRNDRCKEAAGDPLAVSWREVRRV